MTYTQPGMTYTPRIAEPISSLDELEPRIADQGARLSVFRFSIDAAIPRETSRASIGFPIFNRRASAAHEPNTRKHGSRIADQDLEPWPKNHIPGREIDGPWTTAQGPGSPARGRPHQGGQGDRSSLTMQASRAAHDPIPEPSRETREIGEPGPGRNRPGKKKRAPQGPLSNAWTLIEP